MNPAPLCPSFCTVGHCPIGLKAAFQGKTGTGEFPLNWEIRYCSINCRNTGYHFQILCNANLSKSVSSMNAGYYPSSRTQCLRPVATPCNRAVLPHRQRLAYISHLRPTRSNTLKERWERTDNAQKCYVMESDSFESWSVSKQSKCMFSLRNYFFKLIKYCEWAFIQHNYIFPYD